MTRGWGQSLLTPSAYTAHKFLLTDLDQKTLQRNQLHRPVLPTWTILPPGDTGLCLGMLVAVLNREANGWGSGKLFSLLPRPLVPKMPAPQENVPAPMSTVQGRGETLVNLISAPHLSFNHIVSLLTLTTRQSLWPTSQPYIPSRPQLFRHACLSKLLHMPSCQSGMLPGGPLQVTS